MVIANPPLAEPVIDPGGVTIKPPFEMGVANFDAFTGLYNARDQGYACKLE